VSPSDVTPNPVSFRRVLPDELVVAVDGVLELDRDITERQPARIVLTMPDYVADDLAHLLAAISRVAMIFGNFEDSGIDSPALAEVLYAAATSGDYCCPDGGLRHRADAELTVPHEALVAELGLKSPER
jgi:hypothetical protein